MAGILRVDAEARLQRECSQQTLSAYLLISNEDLAMAFMELLGHTGARDRTFILWTKAERLAEGPTVPLPDSRLGLCHLFFYTSWFYLSAEECSGQILSVALWLIKPC